MVGISVLGSQNVAITSHIPKPVIIYPGMGIQEWKECFAQKKSEENDPANKIFYDKCLKILMWAEFCDGALTKVGNFKTESGMNIQFYFSFPSLALNAYFHRNVEKNITAATDPAHRSRTIV